MFIDKNAIKKKKKKIEEEYKIDVSSYPPTKGMLKLRAMRKELEGLNLYNERQLLKIRRMRQRNRAQSQQKVVVKKVINLNQPFFSQVKEVKKVKKEPSRKAALNSSHGGPMKILKKASEFVEKSKLDKFMNMEIIFENLKNNKNKSVSIHPNRSTLFSKRESESPDKSPSKQSPARDERTFFNLITERVTKKVFLAKQKLKFLQKMVMNKKGKVIFEGTTVDNTISLKRKIELFDEILRHIREKSLHKIHLKSIKSVFIDDEETLAIADKLIEYQKKFLSHLINKKNDERDLINIEGNFDRFYYL